MFVPPPADPPHEHTFDELKRYVRFEDRHARALQGFGVLAAPYFHHMATEFYERIREHDGAHAVFTGEAQISRLRASMERWIRRTFEGPYDEVFFNEQQRVGSVHVRVGLAQRYMFTGMSVLRTLCTQVLVKTASPDRLLVEESLDRLMYIQLAIMVESYRDDFISRVQRFDRLERDELRGALERSQHRYVNAVELARALIIGMDVEGRIWMFNRAAEESSGHGRDEVLGLKFSSLLYTAEELDQADQLVVACASGSRPAPREWETPLLVRSGQVRRIRWHLSYVRNDSDDRVTLFAIGTDVTEQNALQERIIRHEKLAAVGTLAAGLAHEIRNPLNGAMLHLTFLERALKRNDSRTETKDLLGAINVVGDEIKRLSALVTEFLEFARPNPPKLKGENLNEICTHVTRLLEGEANAVGVEIKLDRGADVMLQLDRGKIEQVVINLVRNAIEAVASSGKNGTVTLSTRRKPRVYVLEVEDDGPGIASPDAPVFDAFFSTKQQGTGLGLSIVQRIVNDHGGQVEVDSRPGRTVFRVVLPVPPGPPDSTHGGPT